MSDLSDAVACPHQETCQLVLAACERKVKAEAAARLAEANLAEAKDLYERKRKAMNELFAAAADLRIAEKNAATSRCREAGARLDAAIAACRRLPKERQPNLI